MTLVQSVMPGFDPGPKQDVVTIKVSAASCRQAFHGCDPDYIRDVCHSACCNAPQRPQGFMVTIHPSEQAAIEAYGVRVGEDHMLEPVAGCKLCPFKTEEFLCALHGTGNKPMGCVLSPFMINPNGTLIIRNRYRLLRCYNVEPRIPAYKAFRTSLVLLFGEEETARITSHLDGGGGDLHIAISRNTFDMLRDMEVWKKGV